MTRHALRRAVTTRSLLLFAHRRYPRPKLGTVLAAALVVPAVMLVAGTAGAVPIEVLGTRTKLVDEGYLQHKVNPSAGRFGNELTGWVDIRHPALDGTTNVLTPFDRSNHFVNVRTTVVTAEQEGGGPDVAAAPDTGRDLHRSNKIYAQAGISVLRTESGALNLDGNGGRPDVQWPIDQGGEDDAMKGLSRSADAQTVNTYYVQKYDGTAPNGLASQPAGFAATNNDGVGIADAAQDSTYAHEVGHMILNGPAVHMECAIPAESCDPKNWMFETGSDYDFNQIEKNKGRIESSQVDRLYENFGTNGRDFVQKSVGHEDYGNRVDWDFVTDDVDLENKDDGADDHKGEESLYFAKGTTSALAHADHDHNGLGVFYDLGDFAGETFRFADIFSLSLQYADFDRFAGSDDFSLRNGALDYDVIFIDDGNGLHPGILSKVFVFGWSTGTFADNYLGRWEAPVDVVAMFIRNKGKDGTFDGNVQIDAVIVGTAQVPEPSTLALIAAGLSLLVLRRRRGRR